MKMKTRLVGRSSLNLILVWLLLFSSAVAIAQELESEPRYLNTKLSVPERVDDLVSRMTLEEKASQMQDVAVAIPRLGIPAYNWWNEGLHGVARAGYATV